jgi:glyoxylase-like metal-dependent hydrolase (beta-lactamase superfamily II)
VTRLQTRDSDRTFGSVTVLVGEKNGKYPDGNALWIEGSETTAVVDPSLTAFARGSELSNRADLVVLSHVHEDHVAGVCSFPGASVHAHEQDVAGMRSLTGLMEMYGYGSLEADMGELVRSAFHYTARPDAHGYEDGDVFDLGGTRIRCIHLPGHTRGHCGLLVEPEGVLFLGDIDLSSFGPYYGDAWSDLNDFDRTLERVRNIEARLWVSFHHVGIIEERQVFLDRLHRFAAKIGERDQRLLEFLVTPHTLTEMVAHRFLYPPHASAVFIDAVEERTIQQHLDRLLAQGRIVGDGNLYHAADRP